MVEHIHGMDEVGVRFPLGPPKIYRSPRLQQHCERVGHDLWKTDKIGDGVFCRAHCGRAAVFGRTLVKTPVRIEGRWESSSILASMYSNSWASCLASGRRPCFCARI